MSITEICSEQDADDSVTRVEESTGRGSSVVYPEGITFEMGNAFTIRVTVDETDYPDGTTQRTTRSSAL